ncbi:MAG: DUF1003 domain-containing protein [Oscillospiraceae bacterium]
MKNLAATDLVNDVLKDVDSQLDDEEIIHLVLEKHVAERQGDGETLSQRMADALARHAGSWPFIIAFSVILCIWIVANVVLAQRAFDPFPFILLNLVLSCLASIQAPLIMMSQNRQSEKDRLRAENDYKVNLKTEIIIQDLHKKLDLILEQQAELLKREQP